MVGKRKKIKRGGGERKNWGEQEQDVKGYKDHEDWRDWWVFEVHKEQSLKQENWNDS